MGRRFVSSFHVLMPPVDLGTTSDPAGHCGKLTDTTLSLLLEILIHFLVDDSEQMLEIGKR